MTPLQAMVASIASIIASAWIGYLIARWQNHRNNPDRSLISFEISKTSLPSYMFWTTVGLFVITYRTLFVKPFKYFTTKQNVIGVGYVTPIEESRHCAQLVFYYFVGLFCYHFLFVLSSIVVFYYRYVSRECRGMVYKYDSWLQYHTWTPRDSGWVIEKGEWVRDTNITPDEQYLTQTTAHFIFKIPYYTLDRLHVKKPVKRSKTLLIRK